MRIHERKSYFAKLGKFMGQFSNSSEENLEKPLENKELFKRMNEKIDSAVHYNGWFNRESVIFAFQQWSKALSEEKIEKWISQYDFNKFSTPKTVAVIMAGNIPLVGFHDFISVLMAGHKVLVKPSGNDKQLLPVLAEYLFFLNPEFKNFIQFTEDKLQNFDAVIATGSNNTSRYFEYYFRNKKSIIRKNRNSVAVLTGKESKEQLEALSNDIFRYYGLGCRNVSKIYVPENYDFDKFFQAMYQWRETINHAKYSNNYDYNKAVYLMSEFKLLENGFLILKEDKSFGSPIASLFYERYSSEEELQKKLQQDEEKIQCVVASEFMENEILFGKTQQPELWDYADNVDTISFLLNLD
ncbi:acyl-CoA reductase [Autumnicola musiva]|uniref:long-chain-fatty-acyl-CoA reductase n=1 Tax=Autumnicola musiva TaxID=3075589 RepID=A0ABU3D5N7_9FLAO|nr:acyl-CoA reductase [Zunongwangia sp. F117]MDT0676847.1 acyl-CoA reductase [Zunongwangia sp. F117]